MTTSDEHIHVLGMESNVNRTFHACAAFVVAIGAVFGTAAAVAAPLQDTYVGGTVATHGGTPVTGYGDVVGAVGVFDVKSIEARRVGTRLRVAIETNFARLGSVGVFPSLTRRAASGGGQNQDGRGIGFGDLFLAGDWNPAGNRSDGYKTDDHRTGTRWTYGFALDNRWSPAGGSGRLYALNSNANDDNVLLSNDFLSGGVYRQGQEIAVDTGSGTVTSLANGGTWSVDNANSRLLLDFDVSGTALAGDNSLALHWAMTCGNDVIEGLVDVPAPAAAPLLALGLLAGLRRRARKE